MDRFNITISTLNDAFQPDPTMELLACLDRVKEKVARGDFNGMIRDTNGNTVGIYSVSVDD